MRSVTALALAVLLAAPIAVANWSYRGSNEPDTEFDTSAYMFYEPDVDPSTGVHKIYFNGFVKGASEGDYNANVGMLGSRIQPVETSIAAILGFWKDCNNDGYVGLIETAALEYRVELLLENSICRPSAPVQGQAIYPHNDGTWVREMIWIGPLKDSVGAPSGNPTNFYADGTKVWGDWGVPGALPTLICPGGNVGIRSTGAILETVDCGTYFRGVRTLNEYDDETMGISGGWDIHDIDNSDSDLNVDNPAYPYLYGPPEPDGHPEEGDYRGFNGGLLGRDRSENEQRERLVTIVDCDTKTVDSSPDVNQPGSLTDPATYPSAYESLNDTYEVATQGGDADPCAPSSASDEGAPYPSIEGYSEPTYADAGRVEVDHTFEFSTGSRGTLPPALAGTCRAPANNPPAFTQGALGYCVPADLGLAVYRHDGPIGPAWRTNGLINMYQTSVREGLKGDEPDLGGWYASFYAAIGGNALALGQRPSGTIGTYGAEACGTNTEGIHNGWNCDSDAWLARCADPELNVLPELCYRVGFTYHLRDVDCWDNTLVRGSGIRVGLSDFMPSGPCRGNPDNENVDLPTLV